jgi:parallel beta-helix repeat protein/predicted outer membrane repeat protein
VTLIRQSLSEEDSKLKKLLLLSVYLALAAPCAARIIIVDDDGPADFNNIQAAIDDSNNGDVVVVFPGTYTYPTAYDIDFGGRAITVRSTDPNDPCVVAATIIDQGNFYFHSGEGPNSVVDGLTVTRAIQTTGIHCRQSSPTIRNCVIANCSSGAMYLWDSNTAISDCTITGNADGITCFCDGGIMSLTMTDCIISNNYYGGICCSDNGSPSLFLELTGCTITGNSMGSYYDYGGIRCGESIGGSVTVTISDCNISRNSSDFNGGGIYCDGAGPSSLTITNSTISGNSADGNGGGIYCGEQVTTTITNCDISGNSAGEDGGGILSGRDVAVTVANCRISANRAGIEGGGLCLSRRSLSYAAADNCVISGNWAGGFAGGVSGYRSITNCTITGNFGEDFSGGLLYCMEVNNSIIWANVGGQIWRTRVTYSDVEGGWSELGNIDADPCFVDPGKWVDANDPNTVVEPNDPNAVWVDGDYHLKSEGWRWDKNFDPPRWTYDYVTSRCIDAGNPGSPLAAELLTIPDDPGHTWGENLRMNMGAYGGTAQASMPPYDWALLADITNDGIVDGCDYAHQAQGWLTPGTEQPGDFDRNGIVDTNDVGLFVADWLNTTTWHE